MKTTNKPRKARDKADISGPPRHEARTKKECVCVAFRNLAPKGSHGRMLLPGKARNRNSVWPPPKGWMPSFEVKA